VNGRCKPLNILGRCLQPNLTTPTPMPIPIPATADGATKNAVADVRVPNNPPPMAVIAAP
jgi:hypothetical protein